MKSIQLLEEFSVEHCCNCGVAFAMPAALEEMWRRGVEPS